MKLKVIFLYSLAFLAGFNLFAGQITGFSYEGSLVDAGQPANGTYDLQFSLFDASSAGNQLGPSITVENVVVTQGDYAVLLDFGSINLLSGPVWIQVGMRAGTSTGAFSLLSPRDPLFPVAQALFARQAAAVSDNAIGPAQLASGAVTSTKIADHAITAIKLAGGSGSGLDADLLDGLDSKAFWLRGGNAGTIPGTDFIGTKDNQPLEFRVNNVRALRIEPNASVAPSIIAGSPANTVDAGVVGAAIGGGGIASEPQRVGGNYSTIAGGLSNNVQSGTFAGSINGGRNNTLQMNSSYSTISGGRLNLVRSNTTFSTISGGVQNTIESGASYDTIGGGAQNTIELGASYNAIGGGVLNTISSNTLYSSVNAGYQNTIGANNSFSTVSGGRNNTLQSNVNYSTISGGRLNLVQSNANFSTISGGAQNTIEPGASYATISGGVLNTISSNALYSSINAGYQNIIGANNSFSTISGGRQNTIQSNGWYGSIGGGYSNIIRTNANYASIPGGRENEAAANYALAAGRRAKALHPGAMVLADSADVDFSSTANNQFSVRANGGIRFETAGKGMTLDGKPVLTTNSPILAAQLPAAGINTPNLADGSVTTAKLANNAVTGGKIADGTITAAKIAGGAGSGLDADKLDGFDSTAFAKLNSSPTFTGTLTAQGFSGPGTLRQQIVNVTALSAAPNTGYVLTHPDLTTVSLPATAQPGDIVRIVGTGAQGWQVVPAEGQNLQGANIPPPPTSWTPHLQGDGLWQGFAGSADGAKIAAILGQNGNYNLYTSSDYGATWTPRSIPGASDLAAIACSADGTKLCVGGRGGTFGPFYRSTDAGLTWSRVDVVYAGPWRSIASSADGNKLVAVETGYEVDPDSLIRRGFIWTSANGGAEWTRHGDRLEEGRSWQAVASSADGTNLIAVSGNTPSGDYEGIQYEARPGQISISNDSGQNWVVRGPQRNWFSVASSADGRKLAVAGERSLFCSVDGGVTWTDRGQDAAYVASSADGNTLLSASLYGTVSLSTDGGVTWEPQSVPAGLVGISDDGRKLIVSQDNRTLTFFQEVGAVWTRRLGPAPSFAGTPGVASTFQYVANNVWQVVFDGIAPLKAAQIPGLDAGQISTGTFAPALIPALDASKIASGSLAAAQIPNLDAAKITSGVLSPARIPTLTAAKIVGGSGSGLDADKLDGLDSTAFAKLDSSPTFTGTLTASKIVVAAYPVAGTTLTPELNKSYVLMNPAQTVVTLPTTAAIGDVIGVRGAAGPWRVNPVGEQVVQGSIAATAVGTTWTETPPTRLEWNERTYEFDLAPLPYSKSSIGISADGRVVLVGLEGDDYADSYNFGAKWGFDFPTDGPIPSDNAVSVSHFASSPDGSKWVAAQNYGYLYTGVRISEYGADYMRWQRHIVITPSYGIDKNGWSGVACSADFSKVVACDLAASVWTSADGGANWTQHRPSNVGSIFLDAVACSSDGTRIVTVGSIGIYTSGDFGATWTARNLAADWNTVACSADFSRQVASTWSGQVFVSSDGGATWSPRLFNAAWKAVTCSADGLRMAAAGAGTQVQVSLDGGQTWTAGNSARQWQGLAFIADGTKLWAVDSASVYTSVGTPYYFPGTQGSASTFEYLGNNVWKPVDGTAAFNGPGAGGTAGPAGPQGPVGAFPGSADENGHVGLGTAPSTAELDVASDSIWHGLVARGNGGTDVVVAGNLNGYATIGAHSGGLDAWANLAINAEGGNVGVGRAPTANKLEVEGDASKTTAGSWLANSDRRIKTDVQSITNALDKIDQVRLVQFHYTEEYRAQHPAIPDRPYLNVIAQEFQQVFPEHVKSSGEKLPNGDNILQVDAYPLTIYSAAAIQELHRTLQASQQALREKDARINELEARLTALEKALGK